MSGYFSRKRRFGADNLCNPLHFTRVVATTDDKGLFFAISFAYARRMTIQTRFSCARLIPAFALVASLMAAHNAARADTFLCVKQKVSSRGGSINLAAAMSLVDNAPCARGFKQVGGALNDGSHIYGNGARGSRQIKSDTTLEVNGHLYQNFVVDSGVTLTVPSGTVIRTTGSFTNNGTIRVARFAKGGTSLASSLNVLTRGSKPALPGIAPASSGFGTFGSGNVASPFGPSGADIGLLLYPGPMGGGGGGPGDGIDGGFGGVGGDGGGTLVVISRGAFVNSGTIDASGDDGTAGGGGGGGGLLVLASRVSVTSTGPIKVNGGNGALPTTVSGSGGGGGAGGVNVISPSIADNGTINFAGGAGVFASGPGQVTSTLRSSGGCGGASFGAGGQGGGIANDGSVFEAQPGSAGKVNFIKVKPEGLF